MKKLALNLDDLAVESFETVHGGDGRGTVHGHGDDGTGSDPTCCRTCPGDPTCNTLACCWR
ncbi:MAG TPA: pinensin family lanthipeptide [Longimicrobium sp.]|nr:pinensin family lanthipeptide [Longimicrobium sp.]